MKITTLKVSSLATAIAIVSVLSAFGNKDAKTDATATKTTTATVAADEKIVYVNSDSLLTKYEYAKDMGKRLEAKGKAAQGDVAARGQSFQREVNEYQKNQPTMSADQRQATETRLQGKQQDLQTYQQNASAEFQNAQATENTKLYDKIADFAKVYAKEKGYKMVLTYSKANPTVLYGDPSLDVTADVVSKLNEAYAKEKK